MKKSIFHEKTKEFGWILPILLLSAISVIDFNSLNSPVIFSDDWQLIANHIFGLVHWVDWAGRRPFQYTIYAITASINGFNTHYLVLLNFIITFASGVTLYSLIRRVFQKFSWMALPVALVYLAYPVDFTKTWLVMLVNRSVALMALGIIFLLADFMQRGGVWKFFLAMIITIISFITYEGQFGLIMVAAFLILAICYRSSNNKRLAVMSIIAVGFLLIVWRAIIQRFVIGMQDNYYLQLQLSPLVLIYRFLLGIRVFAVDWTIPLAVYLQISQQTFIGMISGITLLCIMVVYLVFLRRTGNENETLKWEQRESLLKSLLKFILLGTIFWVAGYVPTINIFEPTIYGVNSRANLYAIPGAALVLVGLTAYAITLVGKSTRQIQAMVLAAILPFLITGTLTLLLMHQEDTLAWNTQKQIWNTMVEKLPGLKDDTVVFVVLPGYNKLRPLQRLPLTAQWEPDSAIKVLYNNPKLEARYYYLNFSVQQPVLLPSGIEDWDTGIIIPYEKALFVYFNPTEKTIKVMDDLHEYIPITFKTIGYKPDGRLIPPSSLSTVYRWLIK